MSWSIFVCDFRLLVVGTVIYDCVPIRIPDTHKRYDINIGCILAAANRAGHLGDFHRLNRVIPSIRRMTLFSPLFLNLCITTKPIRSFKLIRVVLPDKQSHTRCTLRDWMNWCAYVKYLGITPSRLNSTSTNT